MNNLPFNRVFNKNKTFMVIWQFGIKCNYNCFYCNDDLHNHYSKHLSKETILKIYNNIKKQVKRKITFSITGGEPTLNPFLIFFCKLVNDNNDEAIINTNASKNLNYLKKLNEVAKLTINYHPCNGIDDDKFIKKILKLPNIMVNIMLEHEYLDRAEYVYDQLKHNVSCFYRPVRKKFIIGKKYYPENRYKSYYSIEQQKKVNTLITRTERKLELDIDNSKYDITDMLNEKIFNFNNWKCSSGSNTIYISYDEKVFNATCRQEILGNFDNFKILDKFITCTRTGCSCVPDIQLEKYYPNENITDRC